MKETNFKTGTQIGGRSGGLLRMGQIPEGYKITTARDIEQIEKIRSIWEGMQDHPNSDIDHYLNVITSKPNIIRPHVILLRHNGHPISLVVGIIVKSLFEVKFGTKKIYCPTVKSFTIIHGGFLGDLTRDSEALLLEEFKRLLESNQVDLIRMNYLDVKCNMYNLATTKPGIFCRDRFPSIETHWQMNLPDNIEAFYQSRSRKHRYWLRRMERLLNKKYPNDVKYASYIGNNELDKVFSDAEYIAQKTYQRGLQVGFVNNSETTNTLSLLAKKGRLRSYFIYIKNVPCAFWLGESYGDTFYIFSTGYDPKFMRNEIGTILFVKMLEDLCLMRGIQYVDFGFGDAPYKKRFGDKKWHEATIHIFSSNFNCLRLNVIRILAMGSSQLLIRLLKRLKLLEKVKRLRRDQITRKVEKDKN